MNYGAMSRVTPFDAYKRYLSYRMHFTTDNYDYVKYNGKVNAKESSFEVRKDKYFFYKLSKHKDLDGFLIANMLNAENHKTWVGELVQGDDADQIYADWLKRQQSLAYVFENDINKMDDDYNSNIIVPENGLPKLYQLIVRRDISLETAVILNKLTPYSNYWNMKKIDPYIWPDIHKKLVKYTPFVQFDKDRFRKIALKRFA